MLKTVLFATENESKAKRFRDELLKNDIKMLTVNDISEKIEVVENGNNAIENAILKAKAYAKKINMPIFAMDDNLFIEGIPEDKQPGMYVRRVNGKRLTDKEMIEYYSSLAHQYGKNGKLVSHWVYGMAVINNNEVSTYSWSNQDFYLIDKVSSNIKPGYPLDSISIDKDLNKYVCDITREEKIKENKFDSDVITFLIDKLK